MSKNNKKVSPEPGSETHEAAGMRVLVESDLKTASVILKLVATSKPVAEAVALALGKDITEDRIRKYQIETGLSSALVATIYQTPLIMDHVVDVMYGLQQNIINERKAKENAAKESIQP